MFDRKKSTPYERFLPATFEYPDEKPHLFKSRRLLYRAFSRVFGSRVPLEVDCPTFCRLAIAQGVATAHGASVPLNSAIDWFNNKGWGRSFLFHLNSWDPLDPFFIAHDRLGSDKLLKVLTLVISDWCENFKSFDLESRLRERSLGEDLIWYDMAAGLRVYRLAYLIDVLRRKARRLTECRKMLEQYEHSFALHHEFLRNDKNFRTNNHGMYQAMGQMAAGRRLVPHAVPGAREMYRQGRERFEQLCRLQFTDEGIHKEHSPFYYEAVCRLLHAALVNDLIDDAFGKWVKQAGANLEWFVTPDNRLANLGDTDHDSPAQTSGEFGYLKEWHKKRGLHVKGFNQSGYWIVRHYGEKGENYLCIARAFHSRTHKHADDCTMIWYERGRRILLDGGRCNYSGRTTTGDPLAADGYWYNDPRRVYVERSRAHNTIEVNDRNLPRRRPYGSGIVKYGQQAIEGLEESGNVQYCECEARSLRWIHQGANPPAPHPIRHFRIVAYLPESWLLCIDVLRERIGASGFEAKQWFNLDPRFRLKSSVGTELEALDPRSGDILHAVSLDDAMQIVEHGCGSTPKNQGIYPDLLGWHSPEVNKLVPNNAFAFGCQERSPSWKFATLLSLHAIVADRAYTRFSTSGQRGRLRWSINAKTYSLDYSRGGTDDLQLTVKTERRNTLKRFAS